MLVIIEAGNGKHDVLVRWDSSHHLLAAGDKPACPFEESCILSRAWTAKYHAVAMHLRVLLEYPNSGALSDEIMMQQQHSI
jgi:hypothetical protein